MRYLLVLALSLTAAAANAAPITTARQAIKAGCAIINQRLPGGDNDCSDFVAQLHGDVWTVSEKAPPEGQIGGGAPAVELSEEDGALLNFLLAQ